MGGHNSTTWHVIVIEVLYDGKILACPHTAISLRAIYQFCAIKLFTFRFAVNSMVLGYEFQDDYN